MTVFYSALQLTKHLTYAVEKFLVPPLLSLQLVRESNTHASCRCFTAVKQVPKRTYLGDEHRLIIRGSDNAPFPSCPQARYTTAKQNVKRHRHTRRRESGGLRQSETADPRVASVSLTCASPAGYQAQLSHESPSAPPVPVKSISSHPESKKQKAKQRLHYERD